MPKALLLWLAGELLTRISTWSPTSENSIRLPCRMPNRCRSAFGMVTWPLLVTEVISKLPPPKVLHGNTTIRITWAQLPQNRPQLLSQRPDRSSDASIVRTILALAFSLDLVAEGVETDGQRQFLLQHGCPYLQGYLFSRPMPAHELSLTAG
jgi:hypothetical protein